MLLIAPARAGKIPTPSAAADSSRRAISTPGAPADSIERILPALLEPASIRAAGEPLPLAGMGRETVREKMTRAPREALREGLGLGFLDPGSAHLPDPLFLTVPGRDIPEMRVDGVPAGPVRWPETSLSPVPTLAIGEVVMRPYSPIDGPLSSTGGPQIDVRLATVPDDHAVSAVRLTQASYGTFTEELALRRRLGPFLFHGFYGDSKTAGHDPWWDQRGQTIGLRLGQRLADGYLEWGADQASNRFGLLSTKRGLWDRTAWAARWLRPDSVGTSIEAAASWTWTRGGWWTARGLTERRSRSVDLRVVADRQARGGRASLAVEADIARTFVRRPAEARRLLEDFSSGVAAGWEGRLPGGTARLSAGVTRIAPLAPSPVLGGEYDIEPAGWPRVSLQVGRSVRNRTLPRMPADGEAWVLEGIGLADERTGEQPEGIWRSGVVVGSAGRPGRSMLQVGSDLLWMTRSLAISEEELVDLSTDGQSALPADAQRRDRKYLSLWVRGLVPLPLGFRIEGASCGVQAEGGVRRDLGLAAIRGTGELGWNRMLFSGSLKLDLAVQASARGQVATPYRTLPSQGRIDGIARGTIGPVDLFIVLANMTDAIQTSMSYDGGFYPLPRRHMRAGVRWAFVD
jgi:hypothetical protein